MHREPTWRFGEPGATPFGPFRIAWGEAGPADGPRVLLLHGLYAGAHGYEWRELAPLLAGSARVRVPDLLGAGASDRPTIEYTPAVLADELAALIADAGPDVHVVASSLTGAHALRAGRAWGGGGLTDVDHAERHGRAAGGGPVPPREAACSTCCGPRRSVTRSCGR